MEIISSNNLPYNISHEESEWIYNGMDCESTLAAWKGMQELASVNTKISYDFVSGMRAPALEMQLRGIKVDMEVRERFIQKYKKDEKFLDENFQAMAHAVWDKPLNMGSPTQMKAFFYDTMQMTPIYKYSKGKRSLSTDRTALEKIAQNFFAMPIANTAMALRDVTKKLQFLHTGVSSDGRLRTSFNVVGTETGRWCLTGEHEVMTTKGWIAIKDWNENDSILVSDTKSLFWDAVKKVEFETTKLVKINATHFETECTPEHRLPYIDSHGDFKVAKAGEGKFLSRAILGLPFISEFLPEVETRLYVMMQADGHILNEKKVRFHFSKQRKIDRCIKLLTEAGIAYTVTNYNDTTTYILAEASRLASYKIFDSKLLQHNPQVFVEEILIWDGDGEEYTNTNKQACEWTQTMIHLAGKSATLRERDKVQASWNISYRVRPQKNNVTRVQKADYSFNEVPSTKVYCAETKTGFFLTRYKGKIHLTGNSSSSDPFNEGGNQQNIEDELRQMLIADQGMKLGYFDLEQAESRVVAYVSGDVNYIKAFESGDLHTTVAMMCWPNLPWTGEMKDDRKIADQIYYRHFTYRDIAKRLGHATNYNGAARTLAGILKIPEQIVIQFQSSYFAAFPGIRRWHQTVATQLQTKGYLITALGRKRNFLGRRYDDATLREAIAYEPQSTVGELLNLFLYRIWKHREEHQCLAQIHDAVLGQYPTQSEATLIPSILKLAEIPVKYPIGTMIIPAEAQVGWNWAKATEQNPHGLRKYKGNDDRLPPVYKGILDWQIHSV